MNSDGFLERYHHGYNLLPPAASLYKVVGAVIWRAWYQKKLTFFFFLTDTVNLVTDRDYFFSLVAKRCSTKSAGYH